MGSQIALLLLRGNLINKTAKNLSDQEVTEVAKYVQMVWDDPDLHRTRTAFCSKMAWTIGSEFRDLEAALQEVWIVYWKTTVDVLYHRPKRLLADMIRATCVVCCNAKVITCKRCKGKGDHKGERCKKCYGAGQIGMDPDKVCCGTTDTIEFEGNVYDMSLPQTERFYEVLTGREAPPRDVSILENRIQRRKFYKTTLWNYLKQQIAENKPQTHKATTTVSEYAETAAVEIICDLLDSSSAKLDYKKMPGTETSSINVDTHLIPLDDVRKIHEVRDLMFQHNVEIGLQEGQITVTKSGVTDVITISLRKTHRSNFISVNGPTDEDDTTPDADAINYLPPAMTYSELEVTDTLMAVREKLPPKAKKVFDLIVDPPEDYQRLYATDPVKKSNVRTYLNLTTTEIDHLWSRIQVAATSVGFTPTAF